MGSGAQWGPMDRLGTKCRRRCWVKNKRNDVQLGGPILLGFRLYEDVAHFLCISIVFVYVVELVELVLVFFHRWGFVLASISCFAVAFLLSSWLQFRVSWLHFCLVVVFFFPSRLFSSLLLSSLLFSSLTNHNLPFVL